MSIAVWQQISLFRFEVESCRFDERTLRILESILASIDFKSVEGVVCTLKQFMRHESLRIIEEIAGKSVEHKLLIVDFLVHVFALIGDTESCLALRYEALLMREQKASCDQRFLVSYSEWLTFAEHSLESGYCSVAKKACEKALLCFEMNIIDDPANDFVIEKIKKLKDVAVISASSKSVQAQAAAYFNNKSIQQSSQGSYISVEPKSSASTLFKDGIKRRHKRQLDEYRHLKLDKITSGGAQNILELFFSDVLLLGSTNMIKRSNALLMVSISAVNKTRVEYLPCLFSTLVLQ